MKRRTRFQGIMRNLRRQAEIKRNIDWVLVRREYLINYRTIKTLEQTLAHLDAIGRLMEQGSYNRGGRRGRDIRKARTITSYRSHNGSFAFQLIRYHRSSPHQLVVVGDLGKWQMFFEANLRPAGLGIQDGSITIVESPVTV